MLRTLARFVSVGWRALGEVHLVSWILTWLIPFLPSGVIGWWGWNSPQFFYVLVSLAFLTYGVTFLCALGYLGYRSGLGGSNNNRGAGSQVDRMPLLDLFSQAEREGFGFVGEIGVSPIDFAGRLRQSALDGELALWGKSRRYDHERLVMLEPWVEIPREHWKDYQINWPGAFELASTNLRIAKLAKDNFSIHSYSMRTDRRKEEGFADLHIDRKQSALWLKDAAKALKKP